MNKGSGKVPEAALRGVKTQPNLLLDKDSGQLLKPGITARGDLRLQCAYGAGGGRGIYSHVSGDFPECFLAGSSSPGLGKGMTSFDGTRHNDYRYLDEECKGGGIAWRREQMKPHRSLLRSLGMLVGWSLAQLTMLSCSLLVSIGTQLWCKKPPRPTTIHIVS